jgi:hypothetical protein
MNEYEGWAYDPHELACTTWSSHENWKRDISIQPPSLYTTKCCLFFGVHGQAQNQHNLKDGTCLSTNCNIFSTEPPRNFPPEKFRGCRRWNSRVTTRFHNPIRECKSHKLQRNFDMPWTQLRITRTGGIIESSWVKIVWIDLCLLLFKFGEDSELGGGVY